MFKELAPLLRHRAILLTVTQVEDNQFRVNVIPKKVTDGDNDALTTPVTVTGTVEDLDAQLPATLVNFVSSHLELENTLDRAKAEMDAVGKAAQAEARNKSKTVKKAVPVEAPVKKDEQKVAEPPKVPGLFDKPAAGASATPSADSDEEAEILAEINEGEEEVEGRCRLIALPGGAIAVISSEGLFSVIDSGKSRVRPLTSRPSEVVGIKKAQRHVRTTSIYFRNVPRAT
ncbi:MAG: PRTRC system protein E [Acidobacteriaceae bacterium]|nr:PRTRC system protein E [Acidobacteriaceae bacterium]